MNKKLNVLALLFLIACTTTTNPIQGQPQALTSWNIIDGIMLENWNKDKIESVLGHSDKVLTDSTNLYFDQDTKMQLFAIEYKADGQVVSFSFKPQENEVAEFSLDKIKIRWKNFKCADKSEQVTHRDYIEKRYWLECQNQAIVYYSNKKEVSYLTFTRK
ncbi:MAG: hypothetical protein HYV97_03165 [Bdellovibrio sp.]|nr:hypothetical protein [Bdellovibrio sp.]